MRSWRYNRTDFIIGKSIGENIEINSRVSPQL